MCHLEFTIIIIFNGNLAGRIIISSCLIKKDCVENVEIDLQCWLKSQCVVNDISIKFFYPTISNVIDFFHYWYWYFAKYYLCLTCQIYFGLHDKSSSSISIQKQTRML